MQFISPHELLTALPPVIYERLGPHLQRVRLEVGSILFDVGAPIDYTWFVTRGIVSLRTAEEAEAGRREIECLYNEDGAATEHARRAEGSD